jgi:hypothetical protein
MLVLCTGVIVINTWFDSLKGIGIFCGILMGILGITFNIDKNKKDTEH